MASPEPSQYHIVPPHAEDERESSPHDLLLPPVSLKNLRNTFGNSCSITLNPNIVLRIISTILTVTSFIIFVIAGGDEFIAADIFLACIMIINVLMLIHYTVSHLVKVTVEVRQHSYDLGNRKKPKVSMYLDLAFAASLMLSLIIGNAVRDSWYRGDWKGAVVVGYFVVVMQILLAVPGLDSKSLTISFKLSDNQGKPTPDTKLPSHESTALGGADIGVASRRRAPEPQPRQTAEDLV